MKFRLGGHLPCETVRYVYIAEIYRPRNIFYLPLIVWVYLHSLLHTTQRAPEKKLYSIRWCVTVVQGHLRSWKLVPIESQYAIFY